jgi:hypothetical protein
MGKYLLIYYFEVQIYTKSEVMAYNDLQYIFCYYKKQSTTKTSMDTSIHAL